ncbi:lipid A biosynthesis acyltransferase [Simulacricoccus sp. 17bor-14]|uniref:lysophospholipid acyltransferase family protein n=1 Tax=Myxococcaceae TaxID=31 RepID=UPI0018908E48|nr:lipid A biosynthesis acyltransferase [Simulacricoccus sp. 17bor-14]
MSAPAPVQSLPPPLPTQVVPPPELRRIEGTRPGRVTGFLAGLLLDFVGGLSLGTRDAIARFVGGLAYALGIRLKVALDNLAQALPEKSEAERRAIAKGAYLTMARVVLESIGTGERLHPGWEQDPVVGEEAFRRLRAHVDGGQGALLVTAHFGNWETLGEMLIRRGVPLNALVRPLKGALNTRIALERLRVGAGLIYPKGAIQETNAALKRGECVYMLLDQALPAKSALFVPFFGRPASTTPALAVAAQRTGMPVFVVMGVRNARGHVQMHVEGPIAPPPPGTPEPLVEHTARVTAALERTIRQYPEQWLWLHRRWKVAPPGPAA